MMKKFKTDILALFETHAGGERAERICRGLGFDNSFRVDAVGQSGGLWLLWKSNVGDMEIMESSDQFIFARVKNGTGVLNLVVVYAAPSASRRSGLWEKLGEVVRGLEEPLLIGGDFNTIVRTDERSGGNGQLSPDSLEFGNWINDSALIDMGFRGNKYTWRRCKVVNMFVAKRLDRVLCSAHLRLKWQEARVTHLPFLSSDHAPLYIQLCPEEECNPRRRPFRFEAVWLTHLGFKDLLVASWDAQLKTPEALNVLRVKLQKWNREVFGDVKRRKEVLLADIKKVQDDLEVSPTDALLEKEDELLKAFEVVLEQEEILWFQKSREKMIALGDRNTKYFHTSTVIRRRRNRIEMLKNDENSWISNKQELETLAVDYYRKLYSTDDIPLDVEALPREGFVNLSHDELRSLNKTFTGAEVEVAVKSMGKYKAPGSDGFQPIFYQDCWTEVGESVVRFVVEFFSTGSLPSHMNDALVVLIAKVSNPETITQF